MPSFEPVRALVRGLEILKIVSEAGPVTGAAIARRCRLPQPTVHRILETLLAAGYVARTPEGAGYRVTGRTLALSRGFAPDARFVELGTALVERLREQIGWPSNLAVFDGDAMVIGYSNRASFGLSIQGRIGARIPLLATGVGLVTLAHLDPATAQKTFAALRGSKERWDSIPRLWEGLPERLAAVRRDGYGLADEEYLDAVYQSRLWAVAVPVFRNGLVQGGLSSLVLRLSGDRRKMIRDVLPCLQAAAAEFGRHLDADYG